MISAKQLYKQQVIIGLVITSFVLLIQLIPLRFVANTLERVDGIFYDLRLSYFPPWPDSITNIQIVDIDETSLFKVGRMPWPRKTFADLTTKLSELGAVTIAYDVLFTEPEINPAQQVIDQLATAENKTIVQNVAHKLDGDLALANAISQNDVVLGTLFHQQKHIQKGHLFKSLLVHKQGESVFELKSTMRDQLYSFSGYSANTQQLADKAIGQGFVNIVADADGFIRRAPLVVKLGQHTYPSLALDAFRTYSLADKTELVWSTHSSSNETDQMLLTGVQVGRTLIPTDNQGQILLPFRPAPYYYPFTSAEKVLSNQIDDDRFEGAVVFVGSSATGLADLRTTPVSTVFPGVEIHATIFDALMSPHTLPVRPDWWLGGIVLLLAFIGIVLSLLLPKLSAGQTEWVALGAFVFVVEINLLSWSQFGLDLPLTSSLVLVLCLCSYYIAHGYLSENKLKKQMKGVFDQYVPPAHIDKILKSPDTITLEGEKKHLTVLFSDIRGFTSISESLTPKELKEWLNAFFTPITKDIFEQNGTIDKYVGDMVMAFWGAPLDDKCHATNAVNAAYAMLDTVAQITQTFKKKNWPIPVIGIGINTGDMNVGDMGSQYRLSYTVLGDAVNLGSRLESLTKFYGVDLLIGQETKRQIEVEHSGQNVPFSFLKIDKVNVKGKLEPVQIYCPITTSETSSKTASAVSETNSTNAQKAQLDFCHSFNLMMEYYFLQDFSQALNVIENLEDSGLYPTLLTLFKTRIGDLKGTQLPTEWDGVFVHKEK